MGQLQRDGNELEHRQHHDGVEDQRAGRHNSGHPVVGNHEQQHQSQSDQPGPQAVAQRLHPQVRVDVALLDQLQRHLQAARLQLDREGPGFLPGEVSADLGAPVTDPGPRHGRKDLLVVQEDRDPLGLNVGYPLGKLGEYVGTPPVELQVHHPAYPDRIGCGFGPFQVVAREA